MNRTLLSPMERHPRSSARLGPAALFALLVPGALAAQLTPIGLSEVRGQWFINTEPGSRDDFGEALAAGDFNGDGAEDLATGIPYDDRPTGCTDCGSVAVRYGRPATGLVPGLEVTMLRQLGVDAVVGERFGQSLAAGDFNGDGYDDLAVGIFLNEPGQRGAVQVYFGAEAGLSPDDESRVEFLEEASAGEPWHAVCDLTYFGFALVAGDFDGDAFDDLAIGAPLACERLDVVSVVRGGAVFVAHGKAEGLLPWYGYRISQNSPGLFEQVEDGDEFGSALAAGDFNGDGYDDLAIGVPGEGDDDSGAVQNLMGSQWGLIFANSVLWYPGALGELPEAWDRLGSTLAAGDLDGDGHADLAIGTPLEDLGSGGAYQNTGSMVVAYGAADPFWFDLSRTDHLDQGTILGSPIHEGTGDYFASAFAVGDFDGDGRDDLAIGHFGDDWSGLDSGDVTILMGASPNIGGSNRFRLLGIGWEGLPGDASQTALYAGWALAAGDFDGDGFSDLAIGVPRYDYSESVPNIGAEAILYGSAFADGFECGSAGRW